MMQDKNTKNIGIIEAEKRFVLAYTGMCIGDLEVGVVDKIKSKGHKNPMARLRVKENENVRN